MVKSVAEHSKKQESSYFCNIPGVGTIPGLGEPHSVPVFGVPATKDVPSRKVTPQIALSFYHQKWNENRKGEEVTDLSQTMAWNMFTALL